jgi:hypothetical protein
MDLRKFSKIQQNKETNINIGLKPNMQVNFPVGMVTTQVLQVHSKETTPIRVFPSLSELPVSPTSVIYKQTLPAQYFI